MPTTKAARRLNIAGSLAEQQGFGEAESVVAGGAGVLDRGLRQNR